ncbi:uncharacterized protein LOC124459122 [Xenia sp. Carnegie-2017]|uniref:uncharacterized protein LOC124459122 n=1 Tax=Xenia sp. Carnegie-2017 TaxID=2897299 RepID=UPI001F034DDD|nr:uncharacterized protein LOC124459122 [Xenia sp. Carnegie-2017]
MSNSNNGSDSQCSNELSENEESDNDNATEDVQNERKYIVFDSCLRQLVSQCPCCGESCSIVTKTTGSMVNVLAKCHCGYVRDCNSQPLHGRMPLGNLVFASSILFSGCSPSKVLQFFRHSSIQFLSEHTYSYIQTAYLIPLLIF